MLRLVVGLVVGLVLVGLVLVLVGLDGGGIVRSLSNSSVRDKARMAALWRLPSSCVAWLFLQYRTFFAG